MKINKNFKKLDMDTWSIRQIAVRAEPSQTKL